MENVVTQAIGDALTDHQPEREREAERLLRAAGGAQYFRSTEGRFHARVAVDGRQEILSLRSNTFREWLVGQYLKERRTLPAQQSIARVLQALEANARLDSTRSTVHVRVGFDPADDESVGYLDLADARGHAVKICASGWSVEERPGVHFKRPEGLLALPMPSGDGSIEPLRSFVNLTDSDFYLLIGWMAAALRPAGPYPILIIHGEQGSAKSSLVKVIRQLIDPHTAPLLAEPRSTRDLMVTAVNGWLLAFDNVSAIPGWLSDSLCRLASGGGFAARALFSNDECRVIHAQRPIILNGIEEFVRKGDLADRAVFLHLPPVAPDDRREEAEFWRSFRELHPKILGGLLDAVAGALRELPMVQLAKLPRMADFARFGEALGRGLGWPPETFLAAYLENRRDAAGSTLDDSVFGAFLLERLSMWESGGTKTASPAQWLQRFDEYKDLKATRSARWPKTPTRLGNELRRLAPQLRERGVIVTFSRTTKSRLVTITLDAATFQRH